MSLPAATKFPCVQAPDDDYLAVDWEFTDLVCFEVHVGYSHELVEIDRDQVQSLRDQLTEWLEVTE